jgi:hypothetical protein
MVWGWHYGEPRRRSSVRATIWIDRACIRGEGSRTWSNRTSGITRVLHSERWTTSSDSHHTSAIPSKGSGPPRLSRNAASNGVAMVCSWIYFLMPSTFWKLRTREHNLPRGKLQRQVRDENLRRLRSSLTAAFPSSLFSNRLKFPHTVDRPRRRRVPHQSEGRQFAHYRRVFQRRARITIIVIP